MPADAASDAFQRTPGLPQGATTRAFLASHWIQPLAANPVLSQKAEKNCTEKEIDVMSDAFQRVADEAAAKAAAEATAEATAKAIRAMRQKEISFVSNLLDKGFSFDEAVETAEVSAVPLDELRKLLLPA